MAGSFRTNADGDEYQAVGLDTSIAGERQTGSATASWLLAVPHGNVTRLNIGTTETLVTAAPCVVLTLTGNDGNTGYSALRDAKTRCHRSCPGRLPSAPAANSESQPTSSGRRSRTSWRSCAPPAENPTTSCG